MPGGNCCLPQCTVSRTDRHTGIALFKIPTRKDDFYTAWRNKLVAVIRKYRVIENLDDFMERVLFW